MALKDNICAVPFNFDYWHFSSSLLMSIFILYFYMYSQDDAWDEKAGEDQADSEAAQDMMDS